MARLELIIKGEPQDHVLRSELLSDEVAAEQLATVGGKIGRAEHVTLPWLGTVGTIVRAVRIIGDEPTVRASAGSSGIMAGLADEKF